MFGSGPFVEVCNLGMKNGKPGVQATIAIDRGYQATFENYCPDDNQNALMLLQGLLSGRIEDASCYIWGSRGSGKSHLLFSACKSISPSIYIPVLDLELQPDCLTGIEESRLVCIDDVQSIAHQLDWERQLLTLIDNAQAHNCLLLLTGNCPPGDLNFKLKDLMNRLNGRQVLKLSPATDQSKVKILINRAAERGLSIETPVIEYILHRQSRDMYALIRFFDRIASASLEYRRKITIPFLREMDELQK